MLLFADDLMSLLDAGMSDHSGVIIDSDGMFPGEDMFGYSSLRRVARAGARAGDDRESVFRIRDRRWLDHALREEMLGRLEKDRSEALLSSSATPGEGKPASKTTAASQGASPFSFGEDLHFWLDKDENCARFRQIAALHSELVAVSVDGKLCQWRWNDVEPFACQKEVSRCSATNAQPAASICSFMFCLFLTFRLPLSFTRRLRS